MLNGFKYCLLLIAATGWLHAADAEEDRPNIIVIFTDDHGYADLGCQKSLKDLKTPHIDRLAAQGARCTSGYITAPQCTPSRAGILTGRYQTRFGVDHNGSIPMPLTETLIPERLQKAGYITGMVGKWHLSPNHSHAPWIREHLPEAEKGKRVNIPVAQRRPYFPDKRGFTDTFYGNINRYWATYDLEGKELSPPRYLKTKGFRLDVQTDAALTFIDRHANKKPFFLYLAYFAPHVPLEATDKYLKRFPGDMPERRRTALAMLAAIDDGVGRIRARLNVYGLTKKTVIFFISDNGAPLKIEMKDLPLSLKGAAWDGSRNDPWIGEKGMLSEGGIRVPYIVTWPGTIPRGKRFSHAVTSLDVGSTAVALAGLPADPELDGINLIPYLKGKNPAPPHSLLYWRFWEQGAVRKGKWKYLQAGGDRKFLFDLESEEQEKKNLINDHPELAEEMEAVLKKWCAEQKNSRVPDGTLNGSEALWYEHYFPEPVSREL